MPSTRDDNLRDYRQCPCWDATREFVGEGGDHFVYKVKHGEETLALRIPKTDMEIYEANMGTGSTRPAMIQLSKTDIKQFDYEISIWNKLMDGARGSIIGLIDSGNTPVRWALMEYAPEDYAAHILKGKANIGEFLKLLDQLEAIHSQGIIHLDIKPANIRFASKRWRFGDFGSAERNGECRCEKCSPGFSAPEQRNRKDTDIKTDIFQMGCLLYCIIKGDTSGVPESGPELSDVRPDIRAVLEKALAKKPENRYSTVKEFYEDVKHIQSTNPSQIKPGQTLLENYKNIQLPPDLATLLNRIMGEVSNNINEYEVPVSQISPSKANQLDFLYDGSIIVSAKFYRTAIIRREFNIERCIAIYTDCAHYVINGEMLETTKMRDISRTPITIVKVNDDFFIHCSKENYLHVDGRTMTPNSLHTISVHQTIKINAHSGLSIR